MAITIPEQVISSPLPTLPKAPEESPFTPIPEPISLEQAPDETPEAAPAQPSQPYTYLKNTKTGSTDLHPEAEATARVATGDYVPIHNTLLRDDGRFFEFPQENLQKAVQSGHFIVPTEADLVAHKKELEEKADIESENTGTKALITGINQHNPVANIAEHLAPSAVTEEKPVHPLDALGRAIAHPIDTAKELFDTSDSFKEGQEQPYKTTPGSPERRELEAQAAREKHPYAYYTGAGGAEAATAVGSGIGAGGAVASLGLKGAPFLSAATLGRAGVESAVYGAEPLVHAAIDKDPAHAAEALALGGLISLGIHGVSTAITNKLASSGAEAARAAVQAQWSAHDALVKALIMDEPEEVIDKALEQYKSLQTVSSGASAEANRALATSQAQALEDQESAIKKGAKALDAVPEGKAIIGENMAKASEDIQKLLSPEAVERQGAEAAYERAQAVLDHANSTEAERAEALTDKAAARERIEALPPDDYKSLQRDRAIESILERVDDTANKGTFDSLSELKTFAREAVPAAEGNEALLRKVEDVIHEHSLAAEQAASAKLGPSLEATAGIRAGQDARALSQKQYLLEEKLIANPELAKRIIAAIPELKVRVEALAKSPEGKLPVPDGKPGFTQRLFRAATRKVASLIGHVVVLPAHALGPTAGMVAHVAVAPYINRAVRGAANSLRNSTAPITDGIIHALQTQQETISASTKDFLKSIGRTSQASTTKAIDFSRGLSNFTPNGGSGYSHQKQLEALQRQVSEAQRDPTRFADSLGAITAGFRAEGLDKVADAYTGHQIRLMKVLQTILPKDPSMVGAHPFSSKVQIDEISPETKEKYQRALTIASDPGVLLDLVKNNQITKGDIAIAGAVNPNTLQKMRDSLQEEAIKTKPDLDYQHRLSIGILMGQNIDESSEELPAIQASYAAPQPIGTSGSLPSKGKISAKTQDVLGNNSLTPSQQAAGHAL